MRKYLLILLLYPALVNSQVTDTLYAISTEGDTIKYVSSYLTTIYTNGDPLLFRNVAQHKRGTVSPLSLPISTATQAALDLKATGSGTASGTNTGDNATNTQYSGLAASKENTITAGTTAQYWRGDKSWQTLDKTAVGLSNVANSLQLVAANNLSDLTNAVTARTNIGLGNVTNESKATMFTSPAFTGTPTGIGIPVYVRVTGSNATTTGQALTNITGLSIALVINATYEFEAVLSVSTTAVTTGTEYGVNYSVAGGAVEAGVNGPLTSTASKAERISALNTATSAYLTTSAQTGQVVIKGIVTTAGNAGNFTVSHLKVTSGTSTVFINSYLKVTRIL